GLFGHFARVHIATRQSPFSLHRVNVTPDKQDAVLPRHKANHGDFGIAKVNKPACWTDRAHLLERKAFFQAGAAIWTELIDTVAHRPNSCDYTLSDSKQKKELSTYRDTIGNGRDKRRAKTEAKIVVRTGNRHKICPFGKR